MTGQEAIADVKQLRATLQTASVAPAMNKARSKVYDDISANFDARSAPDGPPWQPRKPDPRDDGHPLLEDTGFLRAAATGQGPGGFNDVQGREMTIGIDTSVELGGIPGAGAHNEGDPSRNLPERHFYSATEKTLDEIGDDIGDAMHERLLAGGL